MEFESVSEVKTFLFFDEANRFRKPFFYIMDSFALAVSQ